MNYKVSIFLIFICSLFTACDKEKQEYNRQIQTIASRIQGEWTINQMVLKFPTKDSVISGSQIGKFVFNSCKITKDGRCSGNYQFGASSPVNFQYIPTNELGTSLSIVPVDSDPGQIPGPIGGITVNVWDMDITNPTLLRLNTLVRPPADMPQAGLLKMELTLAK